MGTTKMRVAVIGAGHLGKIHARLLNSQDDVKLVAVCDPSPSAQQQILDQIETRTVCDYQKVLDEVDGVVIATPTRTHFKIAETCLEHGLHVLVEKPFTDSVTDAQRLVDLADRQDCKIQVGHCERFNPAIQSALENIGQPKFISASRMSGYTFRSTDIGVVHDLMIHDIDLVNSLFSGQLSETRAIGMSMFGHHEDMAQARLQFSCGGVANLTASRCSYSNQRGMQIFGTTGFAAVDLATSQVTVVEIPEWMRDRQYDLLDTTPEQQAIISEKLFEKILPKSEIQVPTANAILCEQKDWINAIRNNESPRISGYAGMQAVEIAQSVLDSLAAHRWSQTETTTTGPFGILPESRSEISIRKAA